jgi:integrase
MHSFYGFTIKKEMERLDRTGIPSASKDAIRNFLNDIRVKDSLSDNRIYFYAVRLRKVAEIIPDGFLNPTTQDIKNVISEVAGRDHVNGKRYSENTVEDYKIAVKRFYRWLLADDGDIPDVVKWIKKKRSINRNVKPDNMITEDEMAGILEACRNPRDRALFSLLYDSGCRVGEVMSLKLRDMEFDDYGLILSVTGKTGFRKVRVIGNSVAYMREWQNAHPHRDNDAAWLFCGLTENNMNDPMSYDDLHATLRKILKRAGITRRIYPHLFRHTRATILASRVTEAPLEAQMGWVHGSRMTQTYVHLSGRDQDNAILKAYGIQVKEDKPIESQRPSLCPRCREPNDPKARFCWKCGMILDRTLTENKLKDEAREIESAIMRSEAIDAPTKKIVQTFPDDFKDLILETVLKQIANNPELKERFQREMSGQGK